MFAPRMPGSSARTPPAAHQCTLTGPSGDACLPSVPVGLSYDPWGGKRIIAAKLFLSQPIFSVEILPKLVAADGDAGGNRENGTERAPRGVLAAAAGDEQDVLALHGHILCLSAQHFLQANRDLLCAGRRFAQQAGAVE